MGKEDLEPSFPASLLSTSSTTGIAPRPHINPMPQAVLAAQRNLALLPGSHQIEASWQGGAAAFPGAAGTGSANLCLLCFRESYDMDAVYVHDPAALAVVLRPSLFTWRSGQIRVLTESVARGMSVMDTGLKRWNRPHAWTERPQVQVAVAVNAKAVTEMLLQRMAM